MAQQRGNGGGNGQDPMLKALHDVVAEVRGMALELRGLRTDTNARFERVETVLLETRHDLRDLRAEVHTGFADLRSEVNEGFAELGQKIDSAADRDRHLEDRVQQLGDRVARLEARNPESR